MRLNYVVALTVFAYFTSNSYSAPVPKVTKAMGCEYQPYKKGTVWIYEFSKGVRETRKVTANEIRGENTQITIEVSPARHGDKYVLNLEANQSGVFLLEYDTAKYDPADKLFSMPFKADTEWKRLPQKVDNAKVSRKCIDIEEVNVSFGTFKAIRIDTLTTEANIGMEERTWYASGIGIIKHESRLQSGLWNTMELKTFKLGK